MTRKIFDWHPGLNVLAKNIRGGIVLKFYRDGMYVSPTEQDMGFVDADDVAEYWFGDTKSPDLNKLPVRAPWDLTWIEYTLPRAEPNDAISLIAEKLMPGDLQFGAYVMTYETEEDERSECMANDLGMDLITNGDANVTETTATVWRNMNETTGRWKDLKRAAQEYECYAIQVMAIYAADRRNWNFVGYLLNYLDKHGMNIPRTGVEFADVLEQEILVMLVPPLLMALGLLNCKNVETKVSPVSKAQAKKYRKAGSPVIERRTLVVHPKGVRYEGSGTGTGAERAWHMCRGHFKTFTEEAPLFGKVTGTFWWGSQARGDKQRGEVHKDYQVERD